MNSPSIQCLDRDGYRCVISGKLDPRAAAENHIKLEAGNVEITQAAHIIPYALNNFETAADSVSTFGRHVEDVDTECLLGSAG